MKKSALLFLKVVFSVGILVYIFTRVVNLGDLWANLRGAKVSYLIAAVALYYIVQWLSASTASVFVDRDVGMGGLLIAATLVAAYGGTRIPPENGVLLAPLFALV